MTDGRTDGQTDGQTDRQTDRRGALQYLPSRAFGAAGDKKATGLDRSTDFCLNVDQKWFKLHLVQA